MRTSEYNRMNSLLSLKLSLSFIWCGNLYIIITCILHNKNNFPIYYNAADMFVLVKVYVSQLSGNYDSYIGGWEIALWNYDFLNAGMHTEFKQPGQKA